MPWGNWGADLSGTPPGAARLRAAGFGFVLRYIGLGSEGKQIHRAEWQDYLANDMPVILIAELGINDAWDGLDDYQTGRARAQLALDDLRAECPAGVNPDSILIGCAADAHTSSAAQIGDAVRYADGFASVVGRSRSGFYGFVETSRAVHNANVVSWHWRAGSEPSAADKAWVNFWQRNTPPQLIVVGGTGCDVNEPYAPLRSDVIEDKDIERIWRWPVPDFTAAAGTNMEAYLVLARARQDAYEANVRATKAEAKVDVLQEKLDTLATKFDALVGDGIKIGATGQLTLGVVPS